MSFLFGPITGPMVNMPKDNSQSPMSRMPLGPQLVPGQDFSTAASQTPVEQGRGTPGDDNGIIPNSSDNPYLQGLSQASGSLYPAEMQNQQAQSNYQQQAIGMGGSAQAGSGSPGSFGGVPQSQMTQSSSGGNGYPAYPNAFNLGDTSSTSGGGFQPASANLANPQTYNQNPVNATSNDATPYGFNPWSMTGEANARN